MTSESGSDDLDTYRSYGRALLEEIDEALAAWIESVVASRVAGVPESSVSEVVADVRSTVADRMHTLIAADVSEPLSGPLEIVRQSTRPVTDLLAATGAEPVERDQYESAAHPGDLYAIGPMSFADLGDAVHEAGIRWGAAKAYLHMRSRDERSTHD